MNFKNRRNILSYCYVFILLSCSSLYAPEKNNIPLGKQEADEVQVSDGKTAYARGEYDGDCVASMPAKNIHSLPPAVSMNKEINRSNDWKDCPSCRKECSACCSFLWDQCLNGPGFLNPNYGYVSVSHSPK